MLKSKIPYYLLISYFAFYLTGAVLLSFAYFSEETNSSMIAVRTFCISMIFSIFSFCGILCLGLNCKKVLSELPLLKCMQVFSSQEMNEPVSGKC